MSVLTNEAFCISGGIIIVCVACAKSPRSPLCGFLSPVSSFHMLCSFWPSSCTSQPFSGVLPQHHISTLTSNSSWWNWISFTTGQLNWPRSKYPAKTVQGAPRGDRVIVCFYFSSLNRWWRSIFYSSSLKQKAYNYLKVNSCYWPLGGIKATYLCRYNNNMDDKADTVLWKIIFSQQYKMKKVIC